MEVDHTSTPEQPIMEPSLEEPSTQLLLFLLSSSFFCGVVTPFLERSLQNMYANVFDMVESQLPNGVIASSDYYTGIRIIKIIYMFSSFLPNSEHFLWKGFGAQVSYTWKRKRTTHCYAYDQTLDGFQPYFHYALSTLRELIENLTSIHKTITIVTIITILLPSFAFWRVYNLNVMYLG